MKKALFMTLILMNFFVFASCSKNDDVKDENKNLLSSSVVGTWKDGKYFLSFGEDGFYSAYIADTFIDSGYYKQDGHKLSCSNTYFNRKTVYIIKEVSETELKVEILYIDLYGKTNNKAMTFTKSDDDTASRNNTLIGRTITTHSQYFGNVIRTFTSFNSGIKSATKGSAAKYPLNFFYIYIGNTMYHQIIHSSSIQVPTISGWTTDYNKVKCWELLFLPNGSIDDFKEIEL